MSTQTVEPSEQVLSEEDYKAFVKAVKADGKVKKALADIKAEDAAKEARLPAPLTKGAVVASDAFFPFPDGLLVAIEAGATAVIQPGGSVNDQKVIDAANAHGVAMVFTGMRHFRH